MREGATAAWSLACKRPAEFCIDAVLAGNRRGEIVGDSIDSSGNFHGFLLRHGDFTTIDIPGATETDANAINSRGEVIVGDFTDSGGNTHGYLLSK